MKRKKLWLIPAVLALALLCACGAERNTPSEPEENAEELSAEKVNADSQEGEIVMDGLTLTNEWDKVSRKATR